MKKWRICIKVRCVKGVEIKKNELEATQKEFVEECIKEETGGKGKFGKVGEREKISNDEKISQIEILAKISG